MYSGVALLMEPPVSAFNLGPGAQSIFLEITTLTSWRGVGGRDYPARPGSAGCTRPPVILKLLRLKSVTETGEGERLQK